ncbi:PREDICTED: putative glycine-rich cell wall structural protein 1 [Camelina sativa]|uniref:Glycine-rich cell wall structural protein 1 n=1 Tax=Camelina sativa TaxID=90675 RepID=A0ABM0WMA0_CAMSA|nr:PREDICTED: putative glycine-rich cell wall structural protein 1 [Camelina sativa]
MEVQRRNIMFHIFLLSLLIHTQIQTVGSLDQASLSSIDLKRHDHFTVETMSFPSDFVRRQLAGGGGSSGGGGGGRGGSSGGGSSGGGSRGGGASGGGSSNRGGGGGSGGNKGGKGGGGGGGRGGRGNGDVEDGDSGGGSGNSRGGGQQVPVVPSGTFPSDGVRLQYSLVLFIFTACLISYHLLDSKFYIFFFS